MKKIFGKMVASILAFASICTFAACGEKKGDDFPAQIYMPDGAPALAMAKLMADEEENCSFHVVDAQTIVAQVTGDKPVADLCVLPLNAASKQLGSNKVYTMLGTVTNGNLYMLSMADTRYDDEEDLQGLIGKTVGILQIDNVPGLTFKAILNKYDIPFQVLVDGATVDENKVNLKGLTDGTQVSPAGGCHVYVAAEPAVSQKVNKTPLQNVGSLQTLYGSSEGYPQAILVVKNSFLNKHEDWVKGFMDKMVESATWIKTADSETICSAIQNNSTEGLTSVFNMANLTAQVIENCNVRFVKASVDKQRVLAFLEELKGVNPNAVGTPVDGFFFAK